MSYINIVKDFLINYIKINLDISNNIEYKEDGYLINISKNEFIRVIHDEIMGWHCFGNIKDINVSEKVENDLETFFSNINEADELINDTDMLFKDKELILDDSIFLLY